MCLICTPLGFIICTRRVTFWQPWILMYRSRSIDCVDLTVADQRTQQRRGLVDATIALSSQLFSWLALETPLSVREHLSAFDYVYPFIHRTFVFSRDVISCNIVSHSVITMYLYLSVGMYITSVLPHSESCLYWCLTHICESISTRVYTSQ